VYLQRVAVCCNVLQCISMCRSVLQCAAMCRSVLQSPPPVSILIYHSPGGRHCNTPVSRCDTLQHTNSTRHLCPGPLRETLQLLRTAWHCNTLQHTAKHCNTL